MNLTFQFMKPKQYYKFLVVLVLALSVPAASACAQCVQGVDHGTMSDPLVFPYDAEGIELAVPYATIEYCYDDPYIDCGSCGGFTYAYIVEAWMETVYVTCATNTGPERWASFNVDGHTVYVKQEGAPVPGRPSFSGAITTMLCKGTTQNYSVFPVNNATSYTWTASGGTIISGQGTTGVSVQWGSGSSGTLSVYASNDAGNSPSASRAISLDGFPPVSVLASKQVCEGVTARFAVSTNLASSYQWHYSQDQGESWESIPGAILPIYDVIGSVAVNNNHQYRCVVSGCGSASVSGTGILTVIGPPEVTVSGEYQFCETMPGGASFIANVTDPGTSVAYTWYRNGAVVTWDDNASGYEHEYMPVESLTDGDIVKCRIVTNNGCFSGEDYSDDINISIPQRVLPTVTVYASIPVSNGSITICPGVPVIFTTSYGYGGTAPAFQWLKNGVPVSEPGEGTYITSSLANNDVISVRMTSDRSCVQQSVVNSNSITIIVAPVTNPVNQLACDGETTWFSVSAALTSGYQWQSSSNGGASWQNISEATGSTYFLRANYDLNNNYRYRCMLMRCGSPVPSAAASLTVIRAPEVAISGENTFCGNMSGGESFEATVTHAGSTVTYTWYRNGNPLTWDDNASGYEHIYMPVESLSDGDIVHCIVASTTGTCTMKDTSNYISISIRPWVQPAVSIAALDLQANGGNISICPGTEVRFKASHTYGGTAPEFQWLKNAVPVGDNSDTYTTATFMNNDVITVEMTSNESCIQRNTANAQGITVKILPQPPTPATTFAVAYIGDNAAITTGTGSSGTAWFWQPTPGATFQAHSATTTFVTESGNIYYLRAKNSQGCWSAGELTVPVAPPVNATPEYLQRSGSAVVTLSVFKPFGSYQWRLNNHDIPGATQATYPAAVAGKYSVRVQLPGANVLATSPLREVNYELYNQDLNFIITRTIQRKNIKSKEEEMTSPIPDVQEHIRYYDGLGRAMQDVATGTSPKGNDVVRPVVYDPFGREHLKYLPFVANDNTGRYRDNAAIIDPVTADYINAAGDFYNAPLAKIADDQNKPYATVSYEPSPLNRILKQSTAGLAWQPDEDPWSTDDHTVKTRYETNQDQEVLLFSYNPDTGLISLSSIATEQYYAPGQLYAGKTLDENNSEVIEYKDREGRMVCRKVQYKEEEDKKLYASSYYIYDDVGNLSIVLPPEAVKKLEAMVNQN